MRAGAQKIIVGYDGSEAAQRALAHAADLAGYGSALTVVSVSSPGNRTRSNGDSAEPLQDARQILASRHVLGRYEAPAGDPAGELVDAVRRLRADLLVVGKRNGGRAPEKLGSVSGRVVHEAPCDVLVVA